MCFVRMKLRYCAKKIWENENKKEVNSMMHLETLAAVHTHTHTLCLLEDKISISTYALLNIYIRDG